MRLCCGRRGIQMIESTEYATLRRAGPLCIHEIRDEPFIGYGLGYSRLSTEEQAMSRILFARARVRATEGRGSLEVFDRVHTGSSSSMHVSPSQQCSCAMWSLDSCKQGSNCQAIVTVTHPRLAVLRRRYGTARSWSRPGQCYKQRHWVIRSVDLGCIYPLAEGTSGMQGMQWATDILRPGQMLQPVSDALVSSPYLQEQSFHVILSGFHRYKRGSRSTSFRKCNASGLSPPHFRNFMQKSLNCQLSKALFRTLLLPRQ
ncbi:hypothetical protein BDW74DRAFT_71898 [Aspergillus multicolor]|uniref:uncharacterized protein n=1 Tax=Aspergillus multicolor TaxID=41759 RepID=UPI003CCDAF87